MWYSEVHVDSSLLVTDIDPHTTHKAWAVDKGHDYSTQALEVRSVRISLNGEIYCIILICPFLNIKPKYAQSDYTSTTDNVGPINSDKLKALVWPWVGLLNRGL